MWVVVGGVRQRGGHLSRLNAVVVAAVVVVTRTCHAAAAIAKVHFNLAPVPEASTHTFTEVYSILLTMAG